MTKALKKDHCFCYFNFFHPNFTLKNYPGYEIGDDILVVIADTSSKTITELYSAPTVLDEFGSDAVGELHSIDLSKMNSFEVESIYYRFFSEGNYPKYLKKYENKTYMERLGISRLQDLENRIYEIWFDIKYFLIDLFSRKRTKRYLEYNK